MTRKLGDLRDFIQNLHSGNGDLKNKITLSELKMAIGERFGATKFVQASVIGELKEFGLLKATNQNNVYEIRRE